MSQSTTSKDGQPTQPKPKIPDRSTIEAGFVSEQDNRTYLLCSQCEEPIRTNDNSHRCGCGEDTPHRFDDPASPDTDDDTPLLQCARCTEPVRTNRDADDASGVQTCACNSDEVSGYRFMDRKVAFEHLEVWIGA